MFRYYNFELSLNKTVLSDTSIYSLFNKISYERFALVIKYFIVSFFQNYFFFLGTIFYLIRKIYNIKNQFLNFYIIVNFLFIFIVFLFADNQEYVLKTSFDRLIYNISPFTIVLLIDLINFLKKSVKKNLLKN